MARVLAFVTGVAVSSVGCASLAGIDDTSGAARGSNAIAVTRVSVGATVVSAPFDLAGAQATYLVANAANPAGADRVVATSAGAGRWTADLADPAPVEVTAPDSSTLPPLLVAFPDRALNVPVAALEHPGRTPAPMPGMLSLTVALDAMVTGTEAFRIFTVGSWSQRDVVMAELPAPASMQLGPLSYDFNSSTSLSGRPVLDALTHDDRFYVLRYAGAGLTGVAEVPAFDQTGDDTLAATMTLVDAGQTLDVLFTPSRVTSRYAGVQPAVSGPQLSWALTAAPGISAGQVVGPVLQSGTLADTDVGVNVAYGNPFVDPAWTTVFTLTTLETRTYAGGALPVTLQAGMSQALVPSDGFVLTLPAGLPQVISLAGKPLATDGQTVAPPSKLVEVTFSTDTPVPGQPSATLYTLELLDLLPNAAFTGLEPHVVLAATGSTTTFELPPEVFQTGHSYTLRATAQLGGYPGLATGDLVTRELPFAQSFLDSAVFTVTP